MTQPEVDYRQHLRRTVVLLKTVESELDALKRAQTEPIAILGMGCRLPGGASTPDAFWRLLEAGVDPITEIPAERWGSDPFAGGPATTQEARAVRWGAFLRDVDQFDPAFFGISPREAVSLDPQQRLVLEVAWEALENAGQVPEQLVGSRTGVFLGITTTDYQHLSTAGDVELVDLYAVTGNGHCFPPGRLSYSLGLEGPSIAVDTACSSSLVAVHLACQSLRSGESTLALVGGVNLMLLPWMTQLFSKTQALSPDGRCKTFDAQANGFVRGEGCGIVVLKRLSLALADGDPIVAVIRGSAVNQDGRSTGLTAPNVLAQQALLRQALENAKVPASDVGYVETHGTGTPLGDPIEVEALTEVLGAPRADGAVCALGSVKSNVGHLEAAAGVTGLIKAALALQHGAIPRNLHFKALNPRISLEGTPFVIPRETQPWKGNGKPRVAGVSSFGMSGTNAHVVLEEAPSSPAPAPASIAGEWVLPLSARSPEALRALAEAYVRFLSNGAADGAPSLGDIAYTASVRRGHHEHRLAVVGGTVAEMRDGLAAYLRGEEHAGITQGQASAGARPKVVFVFPGQGSQWLGMGRELLEHEPAFRAAMEACNEAIRREAGFSVLDELHASESASRLAQIDLLQPVLFAMEVALAALWRAWGIEPDAVVGHSMGEVAAAHVAGALTLDDAARIICRRSRLLRRVSGQGAMALVELGLEQAAHALRGFEDRLSVAVSNGPRSTVLSGDPGALEEVIARLEREGVFCRRVKVDVASHSPQMDPLRADLLDALSGLAPGSAAVPLYSTVTNAVSRGTELTADYWVKNLREPVLFAQAVEQLYESGHALFVEMSPHPILVPAIEEALREKSRRGATLPSLRRGQEERRSLLQSLGALYAHGHAVPWKKLFSAGGRCVPLPTYPWQRQRYWVEQEPLATGASSRVRVLREGVTRHPLLGVPVPLSFPPHVHCWEQALSLKALPYLADHQVQHEAVLPGTAYIEMALAAAAEVFGSVAHVVEQVAFEHLMPLRSGDAPLVQVVLTEESPGQASLHVSTLVEPEGTWRRHATATVRLAEACPAVPISEETPEAVQERCATVLAGDDHYGRMTSRGIGYGPAFQGVQQIWLGAGEALGQLRLPDALGSQADAYVVHPALLDACFQVLAELLEPGEDGAPYVPAGLEQVRVHQKPGRQFWVHGRLRSSEGAGRASLVGDLRLLDEGGGLVAEVRGLRAERLSQGARVAQEPYEDCLYTMAWKRQEPVAATRNAPGAASPGAWLVLMDRSGAGAALSSALKAHGERCVRVIAGERYARIEPDLYSVDPADPAGLRALLDDAFGAEHPCRGAVHLWSLDATAMADATADTIEADQRLGCLSALSLAQALLQQGWRDTPRLWLVTRGAQAAGQAAGEATPIAAAQAPLWGLGRTLSLEHPELACSRVDLAPEPTAEEAQALANELGANDGEDQIALRQDGRYVARLVRGAFGPKTADGAVLRADGTYLVTGGLGGLGLSVAGWMAEQGAGHLVLVGRRAPSEAAQKAIDALRERGADVVVAQADVSRRDDVERVLSDIAQRMPPLRGVVHAAAVLEDKTALELDAERFLRVMAPKVLGAWHLHTLTRERPLDFFVLYSSGVSLLGSPGQANYAAANAFLDALAHHRRATGLAGLSVNWGAFSEVGLAAAQQNRGERLSHGGLSAMTPAQGNEVLGRLLAGAPPQIGVMQLHVRQWLEFYPSAAGAPLWSELRRELGRSAPRAADDARFLATLADAPVEQRAVLIESHLAEQVGRVLRLDAAKLDRGVPFSNLGMDSLMSLELRNRLESSLGLRLSAALLFTYPSVATLAEHLLGRMNLPRAAVRTARREPELSARRAPREDLQRSALEPIAILGVGCRFPGGAVTPEAFWELLESAADGVRTVPPERWSIGAAASGAATSPEVRATQWGGFLDSDVALFDPAFFGISPREAVSLDPQQRLMLEVAWEALERAGQIPARLMGTQTGVFLGMMNNDYHDLSAAIPADQLDLYHATGNGLCFLSGRLSYLLGVRGPSLVVDTACSSSLVAVHLACQSLRSGESRLALAGGVNLMLSPVTTLLISKTGALSPDGRCKAFDAQANGFVRGEGCGIVVLKRLSEALADGDPILAVIRGSAVNQDGRSTGMMAPNPIAQQALLRQAFDNAGVAPSDIGYIETHGTGTSLGDPIEIDALTEVLGGRRADGSMCALGAAKTNVGHLEAAAGVTGLIKAVLTLQHGVIPPNLHFKTLNPRISLDDTPFVIPRDALPWKRNGKPRLAGVSSFGMSGTNAHVVLEEAPSSPAPAPASTAGEWVLPLSARSPEALRALAEAYVRVLSNADADGAPSLGDIAYTASVRRGHHEHRLAVVGGTVAEMRDGLAAYLRGEEHAGITQGQLSAGARPKVVFVFPGQGSQWLGMGRELLEHEPAFRAAMAVCDEAIRREADFSVLDELHAPESASRLAQIDILQPVLFAMGVALAALWRAWGIEPDAVVGHSMGEVAAAHVAGALTLDDAARIICRRSRLLRRVSGQGAMALVELGLEQAALALRGFEDRLSVAVSNGPRSTVLSGDPGALEEVIARLEGEGVFCRRVKVDVASHSPQMDPLRADLLEALSGLAPATAAVPLYSTVTNAVSRGTELTAAYWVNNLREPVLFAQAVERLYESGHSLFLEMSPHPILVPAIEEALREKSRGGAAMASLRRGQEERRRLLQSLGALYASGCDVPWERSFPSGGRCVAVPTYPWQRQRYWLETPAAEQDRAEAAIEEWLYTTTWRLRPLSPQAARAHGDRWVVLVDDGGLGDAVADALEAAGGACERVRIGASSERTGHGTWSLDPASPEGIGAFWSELCADGAPVRGVLHLWGLSTGLDTEQGIDRALRAGVKSALAWVQALAKDPGERRSKLWFVTRGAMSTRPGEPVAAPEQATLWGFGRAASLEHPDLWGGLVDLPAHEAADLVPALVAHVLADDLEDHAALRASGRFVQRLVRHHPPARGARRWSTSGTALITGGLGAIGLHVAKGLAQRGVGHIVLTSRRGIATPEAAAVIASIEALGAAVMVVRADVADAGSMAAVLADIDARHPKLTAIFHAAGVEESVPITELDDAQMDRVMAPKVQGTLILEALTRGRALDAFVCFSSIAGVWGSGRQGSYSAANAYLDAWTKARRAEGAATFSVNWGMWLGTGMATEEAREALERRGVRPMPPESAVRAMFRVLEGDAEQVVVASMDWTRFCSLYESRGRRPLLSEIPRTTESAAPSAVSVAFVRELTASPAEERPATLHRWLRALVAKTLGFSDPDRMSPTTSFFDVGMDSVMAVELRRKLQAELLRELPTTLVFDRPTIDTLATYLLDEALPRPEIGPAAPTDGVSLDTAPWTAAPPGVTPPLDDAPGGPGLHASPERSPAPPVPATRRSGGWLSVPRPNPDAKMRLICFPYAGGAASIYSQWQSDLPADVELCAIQLPGRADRLSEPLPASVEALVASIVPALLPYLDRPFAMFGHCLGAVLMFEVARVLHEQHGLTPAHLFPSGAGSPRMYLLPNVIGQTQDRFLEMLRFINFADARALRSEEIVQHLIPAVINDFRIGIDYRYAPSAPLDVPVTAFAGNEDLIAPPVVVSPWREHTTGSFSMRTYPGEHYFIVPEREAIVRAVSAEMLCHLSTIEQRSALASADKAHDLPDEHGAAPSASPRASAERWLTIRRPVRDARLTLFCFPCISGDASTFDAWSEGLPDVEVCAIELPGRGRRKSETAVRRIDTIVDFVLPALLPRLHRPFAFFGHDFGAIQALETARRLRRDGHPLPSHLFVSSAAAPEVYVFAPIHLLPTAKFFGTIDLLGFPYDPREPSTEAALRADFAAVSTYEIRSAPPFEMPITAFFAEGDRFVPCESMRGWKDQTSGAFALNVYPGDHHAFRSDPSFHLKTIREALQGATGAADLRRDERV